MQEILIVVDMQKDFIDGALGTPEAQAVVPAAAEKIRAFRGRVIFTRDTHGENYMDSREGSMLPVPALYQGQPRLAALLRASAALQRRSHRQARLRLRGSGGTAPGRRRESHLLGHTDRPLHRYMRHLQRSAP